MQHSRRGGGPCLHPGLEPLFSQITCVFTPSHSCDCQRQRDLSGRVCGEKLPILGEQRKILCLEPTRPWPVASACFLVLPFPAALVSRKLKEHRSYVFCSFYEGQSLWLCTLLTFHLLSWASAMASGSKFDNLSSICRTHLVQATNQLPIAVLWLSHICLCMGTTNKQMSK